MTVQEMIDELVLKYPHSYTNIQVVKRMDRMQKRIFRGLNTLVYSTMNTVSGQAAYSTTYKSSQIRKVIVDGLEQIM